MAGIGDDPAPWRAKVFEPWMIKDAEFQSILDLPEIALVAVAMRKRPHDRSGAPTAAAAPLPRGKGVMHPHSHTRAGGVRRAQTTRSAS